MKHLQLSDLSVFFRGGPWGRQLEGGPASWMIPASQHSGPVHLPALGCCLWKNVYSDFLPVFK